MADGIITVDYDRNGRVVAVRKGRRVIERRRGKPGRTRRGSSTTYCERVAVVVPGSFEFLWCTEKGDPPPPKGSDPCCYRDPGTGDEWCWC